MDSISVSVRAVIIGPDIPVIYLSGCGTMVGQDSECECWVLFIYLNFSSCIFMCDFFNDYVRVYINYNIFGEHI